MCDMVGEYKTCGGLCLCENYFHLIFIYMNAVLGFCV